MATPSASSTSAVPHFDEDARAPCLHTGTPAPATTSADIVLTLMEWLRSPPVPTMSTARSRSASDSGTISAASRTASSSPDNSSGVSPLARSAMMKPINCAGVASPAKMVAIAARAWTAGRSSRSSRREMIDGQPPMSTSAGFTPSGYGRCWISKLCVAADG